MTVDPRSTEGVSSPELTSREYEGRQREVGGSYAWYTLGVLVLVYVFNFIDRQLLAVLAEDIKKDLGIGDAELGFLYGTVFGVFYALMGVPLGRLADVWSRTGLLAMGLALWSGMTALSGFARNFGMLAFARIGVGVGEASAAPAAYSMLSDLFPRDKRATAISLFSAGVYIGSGLSLYLGGAIKDGWNAAFPAGGPLGVVGWQAAFLALGIPGLVLAVWVKTLREPVRGISDGLPTPPEPHPWRQFFLELSAVLPPLTLVLAARQGSRTLALNLFAAVLVVGGALFLSLTLGNWPQWAALGTGVYSVFSWAQSLKHRDPPSFHLIWGTPTLVCTVVGSGLIAMVTYATLFWSTPYAIRSFGVSATVVGMYIGAGNALGGIIGVVVGGQLADRLKRENPSGRIKVGFLTILGMAPVIALQFTTTDLTLYFALAFLNTMFGSMWVGVAGATIQDLVLPRMRGIASGAYLVGVTLIGLGLGPYAVGKVSQATSNLGFAVLSILPVLAVAAGCLWYVYRHLPLAESSRVERARAAGEGAPTGL